MRSDRSAAWRIALGAGACLVLPGCSNSHDPADGAPGPSPSATSTPTASAAACLPFGGPPDGSAKRPYLKRAMALTCREDVKRLQQALGIPTDGLFDNDTATAVIAAQQPYACITAGDGQVGPQTWALIVDGTEPCRPGKSAAPMPGWARCGSGATDWALQARDGSVLRRCGSALELVHAGKTHLGAVREIGSSVCADFDENFSAPAGTGTTICVSNPATDDTMQASRAGGQGSAVWMEDVVGRYLNKN